jgi:uncharacterized protein
LTPGPLVVGVAELLRHPGTQRPLALTAELDDVAISTSALVPGSEVRADLVLEAISDHGLTVKGTLTATWVGECRRCLKLIEGTLAADVEEVFDTRPVEGETYRLDGDRVDLEPMVRDNVLLSLPLAPLCEDACAGPEPEHHPIGTEDDEPPADPRWSALSELEFE